jgi:ribosomal-protein-alanine N-acetyltransferase
MKIKGNEIYLKLLLPEDVSENYYNWMNDEEITRFLESRWSVFSMDDLKKYVQAMNSSQSGFLFGIFLTKTNEHIGNIKIGNINPVHRYGDLGLIIGIKKVWGKGYGTEAVKLATDFAFKELNLNKLIAGIYEGNTGSYRAFIKAGYQDAGRLKKHRFYNGEYVDEILVEKCR